MASTEKISVNSSDKLSRAISALTAMYKQNRFVVVSMRPGKDRTLDQNALWFAMYQRISDQMGMDDVEDARRYCKLHHGVAILLKQDEAFREQWYATMRDLPYELKLSLMGECSLFGPDGFPVTRLFNRAQGVAYTNRIIDDFSAKGVVFSDLLSEEAA